MRHPLPRPDPALVPSLLAALFCVYAAVAVPAIALLMPPFQAADELNHAERANQVAAGGLLASRLDDDDRSGGAVDLGLDRLATVVGRIRFHREIKETRAMADQAAGIGWGGKALMSFRNTAIYPPLLYLPSALGQLTAKAAHLSVLHGMILSRLLNGAVAAAIAAAAIAVSGGLAPLLFTLLCLPMVLALFGSLSQDALIISLSALSAALLARMAAARPGFAPGFALGCAALTCATMARVAYLPLCLLPLLLPVPLRARLAATGGAVAAVLGWTLLADHAVLTHRASVQMAQQLHALLRDPGLCPVLFRSTVQIQWVQGCPYCREAVGVLGWLDTPLPNPYYALAGLVLLAAFAASRGPGTLVGLRRLAAVGLVAAVVGIVFALQYLSWSPIGSRTIDGVQGRYFLPLVPFLGLVLPRGGTRMPVWLFAGLCGFPALSIVLTLRAIVFRYYL